MIELALLGLTIAGFLVLLDRKDKRMHERLEAHRQEVRDLCVHIQAPEAAVLEHVQAHQPPPSVQHALTDEQAAEAAERARVIAEMERMENEALR